MNQASRWMFTFKAAFFLFCPTHHTWFSCDDKSQCEMDMNGLCIKNGEKEIRAETVSVSSFQGISQEIVLKASFKGLLSLLRRSQRRRKRRKHRPANWVKIYKLHVHRHAICFNRSFFCAKQCRNSPEKAGWLEIRLEWFLYCEAHFCTINLIPLNYMAILSMRSRLERAACRVNIFESSAGLTTRHNVTTLSKTYQWLQRKNVANFFAQEASSVAINTPTLIKSPIYTDEVTFMST